MKDKAKYFKFLKNSRTSVMTNVVVDGIEFQIRYYAREVDWDRVEERLKSQLADWITDTKDVIDFYEKNYAEVDSILNKDYCIMQKNNAVSVTDVIKTACLKAYESLLSDFVGKLKEL